MDYVTFPTNGGVDWFAAHVKKPNADKVKRIEHCHESKRKKKQFNAPLYVTNGASCLIRLMIAQHEAACWNTKP